MVGSENPNEPDSANSGQGGEGCLGGLGAVKAEATCKHRGACSAEQRSAAREASAGNERSPPSPASMPRGVMILGLVSIRFLRVSGRPFRVALFIVRLRVAFSSHGSQGTAVKPAFRVGGARDTPLRTIRRHEAFRTNHVPWPERLCLPTGEVIGEAVKPGAQSMAQGELEVANRNHDATIRHHDRF